MARPAPRILDMLHQAQVRIPIQELYPTNLTQSTPGPHIEEVYESDWADTPALQAAMASLPALPLR